MARMTKEERDTKRFISNKLAAQGYPTYADIFSEFDLHLTSNPKVIGYMVPAEGYITINRNIDEDNFSTFSIEYDILLQAICSEIDVVAKRLCLEYNYQSTANDIVQYISEFQKRPSEIENKCVTLQKFNIELNPWKNISGFHEENGQKVRNIPSWWNGYNAVKHRRITLQKENNEFTVTERNIKNANLKNVLNALAALYILEKACKENMNQRFRNKFKELGSTRQTKISLLSLLCYNHLAYTQFLLFLSYHK